MAKRLQGRPTKRQQGEGGRERLLSGLLKLVRTKPALANQRSEVARAAGVTPSLLCYYFPNHPDMIQAAIEPVVEGYMRSLMAILDTDASNDDKLRSIVLLFIETHSIDPNVVDLYMEVVQRKTSSRQEVEHLLQGYQALITFFTTAPFSDFAFSAEPGFLVFALWGMCRSVAQDAALPVTFEEVPTGQQQLVERVLRLLSNKQSYDSERDMLQHRSSTATT